MEANAGTASLQVLAQMVVEFLESKSFFCAERALRAELALLLEKESKTPGKVKEQNLYTSELEKRLNIRLDLPRNAAVPTISNHTPPEPSRHRAPSLPHDAEPTSRGAATTPPQEGGPGMVRQRLRLYTYHLYGTQKDESTLRKRHGTGTPQQRVLFHDRPEMPSAHKADLAFLSLPIVYNPHVNGLEDDAELQIDVNTVIIGRYRVVAVIGKGSFSRVFQCFDLQTAQMVSVKVIRNEKDCFDAGLGEIKVLALLAKHDPHGRQARLRLLDYFYYCEHLLVVTELLRDSTFQFYKFLDLTVPQGLRSYFTVPCLGRIAHQLLHCLDFLHGLGLRHCDVKPENVCFSSVTRCEVRLIDFGSSLLTSDTTNSYVQSRWYRAPEVALGLPWDAKVDLWSFGCLLCELLVGQPIFYGATVAATLAAQQALLGPHPPEMLEAASHDLRRMFFGPGGGLYVVSPAGRPEGVYEVRPVRRSLAEILEIEDAQLLDFLSSLLAYDPAKRPTAAQALQHPWMVEQSANYFVWLDQCDHSQRHGGSSTPVVMRAAMGHAMGAAMSHAPPLSSASAVAGAVTAPTFSSTNTSPVTVAVAVAGHGDADNFNVGYRYSHQRASGGNSGGGGGQAAATHGPVVPEDFGAALRVQGDGSRSHEWRSRFTRFLAKVPSGSIMPGVVSGAELHTSHRPSCRAIGPEPPNDPPSLSSPEGDAQGDSQGASQGASGRTSPIPLRADGCSQPATPIMPLSVQTRVVYSAEGCTVVKPEASGAADYRYSTKKPLLVSSTADLRDASGTAFGWSRRIISSAAEPVGVTEPGGSTDLKGSTGVHGLNSRQGGSVDDEDESHGGPRDPGGEIQDEIADDATAERSPFPKSSQRWRKKC